jgi:tellurite resistance protein
VREDVFLAAVDVAASDGNIEPAERKVLEGIAARLGVNSKNFI